MPSVFFTSDTHFGHANIIKYCNRPFSSAAEMDAALIANWNSVVAPGDVVYHLGDFAFADPLGYLERLNGDIRFLYGNHDKQMRSIRGSTPRNLTFLGHLAEVTVGNTLLVLCHYAMRVWNKSHRGAWHLYGHSHGTLPDDSTSLSFDVGVDCHNYRPLSMEEVRGIMRRKTPHTPLPRNASQDSSNR